MAQVYVTGGAQLERLGARLAAAGTGLRREVRAALRVAVKPVIEDIKADMMAEALPVVSRSGPTAPVVGSSGGLGGGRAARYQASLDRRKKTPSERTLRKLQQRASLRASIAAGTGATIGLTAVPSVTIRVNSTFLPADQKSLPRAIEGGRWRHPVYGHPNVWVAQEGEPYFYPPIRRKLPEIMAKVEAVAIKYADVTVTRI